jgi:hypothetical protein
VFDIAWTEGQAISIEQAVAEARRLLAAPTSASVSDLSSPRLSPRELDVLRHGCDRAPQWPVWTNGVHRRPATDVVELRRRGAGLRRRGVPAAQGDLGVIT